MRYGVVTKIFWERVVFILSRIETKDGKIMAEVRDNRFCRIRTL